MTSTALHDRHRAVNKHSRQLTWNRSKQDNFVHIPSYPGQESMWTYHWLEMLTDIRWWCRACANWEHSKIAQPSRRWNMDDSRKTIHLLTASIRLLIKRRTLLDPYFSKLNDDYCNYWYLRSLLCKYCESIQSILFISHTALLPSRARVDYRARTHCRENDENTR